MTLSFSPHLHFRKILQSNGSFGTSSSVTSHTRVPSRTANASPQPVSLYSLCLGKLTVRPLPAPLPEGTSGQQRWLCSSHNTTVGAGMNPYLHSFKEELPTMQLMALIKK